MMSAANRLFSYFPLILTAASFAALGVFSAWPSGWSALLLVFVLYLLPPMILRIVYRWARLKHGVTANVAFVRVLYISKPLASRKRSSDVA